MSELGALLEREMEAIRSPEFGVVDVGRRVERRQRTRRVRTAVVALALAAIAGVGLGSHAGRSTGLYTARASDGGDQIQVTSPPGRRTDEAIGYSPEGSKILFLRSAKDVSAAFSRATKDLFVVDADGSGRKSTR